ncbi:hypothetical protein PV387_04585 [Streptomyces sp. ME02-6987-2C]|uniref:hypothetical protein n=1 Tax=unclassified Streptomyces TaxID=2593676 RepID=UPI00087AE6C5|nr:MULTISPECIES: hypothetical protein [unclassified Streptomyces]MDX3365308.1 hypothetical protein [Streptomyces sp. ME02-6987-2C]MDX3422695.1 hypothetical protein [Streptomyces sp. ME02-6985-2c]REH20589.1 hypothetical protein BX268_2371 [Streptomyces sp. 2221.1]SDT29417.1 hypothetical protein SAMN05428941_2366 [Streptomyces sp. 2114.2]
MSEHQEVHSVARVAATLRTVLAGFREGHEQALPLLVGEREGGKPEAVILPYDLFVSLCQALEDAEALDISDLAASRLADAPLPGEGLDTAALARLVAKAQPDHSIDLLQAGGTKAHED